MKNFKSIIELKLEEFIDILSEDITAGRFIVYHRTKSGKGTSAGIAANGYRIGDGAYYGPAVYTNYKFEGTQTEYSKKNYGDMIIESRVLNLKDFLILDKEPAKKVYKSKYSVESQLKKILKGKWNKYKDTEAVRTLIAEMEDWPEKTGEVYDTFYQSSEKDVAPYFRGVLYNGNRDAYTCIIYDSNNIEPLRYSLDDGETWKSINNKNIIKRIKSGKFNVSNLPIIHLRNAIKLGHLVGIKVKDIENLPKNELEFFVDNVSVHKREIHDDVYEALPEYLKKRFTEKRIKKGYSLSDSQYKYASSNLKKLYIEKTIEKGEGFSPNQYNDLPNNLKISYLKNRIKKGIELTSFQYNNLPNNLKISYLKKIVKTGEDLPIKYENLPKNLKKLYVGKRIEKKRRISAEEYRDASDESKKLYIEHKLENTFKVKSSYSYLTNEEYKYTPNKVRQFYFEKLKYYNHLPNQIVWHVDIDYIDDYKKYLKNNS